MLGNVSKREKEAALRRAIMATCPDYFSWPTEAQDNYRLNLPEDDKFRIQQRLLKSLFAIQVDTKEQLRTAFDTFSFKDYRVYNSTLLSLEGIGENYFYLNEWLGHGRTLLDFKTLYDYDLDNYCFQEHAYRQENPNAVSKPYRGNLYCRWARLEIDGAFYYATLFMAATYLYSCLDEFGFDYLEALIPHHYVQGPDHGKRDGKGVIWNLEVDAAGMEGPLEALRERYYRYLVERQDTLLTDYDERAETRLYLIDKSQKNEPQMYFIFSDKTALQAVRLGHFMNDCQKLSADSRQLTARIKQEKQAAASFLDKEYRDILYNFDPKVVKLRKKKKIVMTDKVLQDLDMIDTQTDDPQ